MDELQTKFDTNNDFLKALIEDDNVIVNEIIEDIELAGDEYEV